VAWVLGFSLSTSATTHVLLNALVGWTAWLVTVAALTLAFSWLAVRVLSRQPARETTLTRHDLARVGLVVLLSATWLQACGPSRPELVFYPVEDGDGAKPVRTSDDQAAWGDRHAGVEVHATTDNNPQWTWRIRADLPQRATLLGGRIQMWVTQPEWAVLNPSGQVFEGGDGVQVRVSVLRAGLVVASTETTLDLHHRPEQRRWTWIAVPVPVGGQSVMVEALPGPPGSNNWHDRVWLGAAAAISRADVIVAIADRLVFAALLFLPGIAVRHLVRPPYSRRRKVALLLVINAVSAVVLFALGELYLRVRGDHWYQRTYPGQHPDNPASRTYFLQHDVFGWTGNPADPDVNAQGFRNAFDFSAVDVTSPTRRVMMLGDSFMFGYGMAFIDDDVSRVLEAYRMWEGLNKPSSPCLVGSW
jgi:hypothetical protein